MLYKIVNGNVAIDFSNKLVQVNRATRHSHSFYHPKLRPSSSKAFYPGGVLPSKRLLGICRWMGSHFHYWTDYNGVTFLVELLEWGRKFSGFLG